MVLTNSGSPGLNDPPNCAGLQHGTQNSRFHRYVSPRALTITEPPPSERTGWKC